MRFTLPESSHRRQRSLGGTVLSAALHAAVIGGTLVATGMSAERPVRTAPRNEELVYLQPREHHNPVPPAARAPRAVTPVTPAVTPPPLPPTNVVIDPSVVPTSLPAIDQPLGAPFDSTASAITGVPSGADSGSTLGAGDDGAPFSALAVDREVVVLRGAAPRYPSMLASAGIEGTIVLHFVVDTLGRVEPSSVEVVRADQRLFVESVREALSRTRFVPAEVAGRKVRQLVEQSFTFALSRR
jgi:protein TonB